jgi:ADP-ribose pyrophosphatase YjhB (NUDIX family)
MVKGWGKSNTWGFPKGKISKQEVDSKCAAREVFEEIGYDISDKLDSNQYVEATISGKRMRLFIIRGVPESTIFHPQTRKEISQIAWFPVSELLTYPPSNAAFQHKTWAVGPFVNSLRRWIDKARGQKNNRSKTKTKKQPHTPHQNRPKQNRQPDPTVYANDKDTFGNNVQGWDPEEMFAANAKLFGVQSTVPEENTVLTPAERMVYESTLSRLGLQNDRPSKKTPKENRRPRRSEKPSEPQAKRTPGKEKKPRGKRNSTPPRTTTPRTSTVLSPQPPTSHANAFLDFKFDTASIMGSFDMRTPIAV